MTITVVTSITDDKIYDECLGASLRRQKTPFDLIKTDSELKLTESYLKAIPDEPETKYLLIVHQDFVFCEDGHWLEKAERLCDSLPKLGVAGIAGWMEKSEIVRGYFVAMYGNKDYSNLPKAVYFGKKYLGVVRGQPFDNPEKVQVLDDMCMIIPSKVWMQQKFDPRFEFHLNGQDYCLAVKHNLGLDIYILPLKTYEVSTTSYVGDYYKKHGHLRQFLPLLSNKWGDKSNYAGAYALGGKRIK